MDLDPGYDAATGTAGGAAFGAALERLAAEKELTLQALALAARVDVALLERVVRGEARLAVPVLARLARALRLRAIGFLQRTGILGLEVYAAGLDPLFFLPDGPIRHDARIYMREINPRHAVPEGDMTTRNPVLGALAADALLEAEARLEVELGYLLAAATRAGSKAG
ncbi:MAG TPA: hypothetical protein VFB22_09490 [Candidatus Baltobacteraceae bacterium]|nr:hypothetical protein [Candidatus Baltobacteraceae bacterium]